MHGIGSWVLALALGANAQAPNAAPQFTIVSIKPAGLGADGEGSVHSIRVVDPTHWQVVAMGVSEMISFACGLNITSYSRIVGLPDWADRQEFNVEAIMPPGTTHAQVALMVRAMLADRFQMVAHLASRQMAATALTVAPGGPKFKRAADCEQSEPPAYVPLVSQAAPPACGHWSLKPRFDGDNVTYVYFFHGVSMAELASFAETFGGPVVDRTGLPGAYDFPLELPILSGAATRGMTREERDAASEDMAARRADAYRGLGLILGRPQKLPVPVVVVDHIALPTPN